MRRFWWPVWVGVAVALGCSCSANQQEVENPTVSEDPQGEFWGSLEDLCGQSFEGLLVESNPPDPSLTGQEFVMEVRSCEPGTLRIPFHIGNNRSRTWVLSRTAAGLRLKHDHRREDGTEDEITQYGGDTVDPGTSFVQEFHADSLTASLIPAASTNVWTVQVEPGVRFVYALRREGTDRRFKVQFDLQRPRATPPPPWGD